VYDFNDCDDSWTNPDETCRDMTSYFSQNFQIFSLQHQIL